ncbi:hypothetical protein [Actinomycetospora sp. TBRC 11914]|uniref:hypothetical protein n=1 Tax=Actinomycetospora sp. TBRC 11914 TaxID=2729387 RepID=UPI001B7D628E|nr:hypothetical protein [Actinomycetospora sp. TBRC 11914]
MTAVIIVIVVVVVLLLAGGGFALARRRRSQQLEEQFGPEYDRAVERSGSKSEAEKELADRRKRHAELDLRPLDPQTRERFQGDWKQIQGEFVDDPGGAVEKADSLVTTIMRERGYPVEDFDRRADDISVEHPRVVENYREARRVRDGHRNGSAGTEDLRGAVTSYRSLVDALLDERSADDHGGGPGRDDGARGEGRHREGDHRDGPRGDEAPRRDDGPHRDEHLGDGRRERESAGGAPTDGAHDNDGSRR